MKKLFALLTIFTFTGVLAFSFNSPEEKETDKNKSECSTVAAAGDCGSGINAVLTSGTKKSSDCSSSHESARAVSSEKSSDCGVSGKVTRTASAEKSSDCGVSGKVTRTASAEKSSDCCSKTGNSVATPVAVASGNCSSEKTDKERIAENN